MLAVNDREIFEFLISKNPNLNLRYSILKIIALHHNIFNKAFKIVFGA